MPLASIYASLQQEMLQIEEALEQVAKVDLPGMTELLSHVLKSGGKRVRPALTLLAGKFYHYNLELLIPMATAVELLHTATLVHDDTIDNSSIRRGKPTINSLWGESTAVLLGDYLFASSAYLTASTKNLRVMKLFAQTLMALSSGEIGQTFTAFDFRRTRQQYYQQIGGKTAALFSMATESGAILSDAPEEAVQALRSYGYNMGMSFQIIDDILDFTGEEEIVGKPVGSDLIQGNLTLPALLFLERCPEDSLIKEIFDSRGTLGDLRSAIERIRQWSIIDDCFAIAAGFCSEAYSALNKLPEKDTRQALAEVADYVIERRV